MISIQNFSKDYQSKKAVTDRNLTIENGKVIGLIGPNGAGKSTTLKAITGIITPTKGEIFIDSVSIKRQPRKAKRNIGYVPDTPDRFLGRKGYEYLAFISSVYHMDQKEGRERARDRAKELHLQDALSDRIVNYSHGRRQKIFIIGSLLSNPNNWILDEPRTGLDPQSSYEVKKIRRKRAEEGKAVLFSNHVLDVAEKVCDEVAILDKGKLCFLGTIEQLRKKENLLNSGLEDLFLHLTGGAE